MSVIIRLQNLPWSANAADIRKFFHGLSIPEGGVHIVGGEQGDAFIAFSTDEDARQAMLIDGGRINEVKIKLLLSSRSEMQKVIETARQQALNLQNYMQMPAQPAVIPAMPNMQNLQNMQMMQMAQQMMPMGIPQPQIPLANQWAGQIPGAIKIGPNAVPTPMLNQAPTPNQNQTAGETEMSPPSQSELAADGEKAKSDSEDESKKGSHRDRDSSHSRSRSRSKERRDRKDYRHRDRRDRDRDHGRDRDRHRDRDRDRDRERDKDRDRDRDKRRRSSSRDRYRNRRHRSRSRDRSRKSESSRDRDRDRHGRDRDRDRKRSSSKEATSAVTTNGEMKGLGQDSQAETPTNNGSSVTSENSPIATPQAANQVPGFSQPPAMLHPGLAPSNAFPPIPEPPKMPVVWPFTNEMMPSAGMDGKVPWGVNPQPGALPSQPGTLPPPPMFMPPEFFVNSMNLPPKIGKSAVTEERSNHVGDRNESSMKESLSQKNCCVQIQNMSKAASYIDIERFFHGLDIASRGIKMINDDDGNRSGLAYVRFASDSCKAQALKLNGRPLRDSRVKINHLDDYIYNEAIDDFHPPEKKLKPARPAFDTLKLSQLPRYIKEKEVSALFMKIRPRNVILYPNKHLCDAFVEFENPKDAELALQQSASIPLMVGRNHVVAEPVFDKDPNVHLSSVGNNMFLTNQPEPEILPARQDPRRRSLNEKEAPTPVPTLHVPDPLLESPVMTTDCLLLKGLPFKANDRDILDFFSDVGIVPSKIHIMFDKQGKPAGDAFCEFNTPDEASRGLVKQNAPMDRSIVTVVPVPRHEMMQALGILPPGPLMPPHMPPPGMPGPGMPRMMPPMDMRMPMHHRPIRPDMFPGGPNFRGRMENDYNNDSINVDGFGKPGCVVSMENVPFSAGVEDILHFFHGFELVRQNIIRRFDDDGKPTGDARVCLKTHAEAQKACQKLHKQMIRNRIIYLSIVD